MIEEKEQYFLIKLDQLPANTEIYSFNLFIYNPINDKYSLFLHANSPLTDNKREFIKLLENKEGSLAVSLGQKRTFLMSTNLSAKDIPGLTPYEKHPLEKAHQLYVKNYEMKKEQRGEDNPYLYKIELKRAILNNDYKELIEEVRSEVLTFAVDISETVSLSVFLAEELLTLDNTINRIVVTSFIFAKEMNIKEVENLAEIVCGAFFVHLGFTQLDRSLTTLPYLYLPERQKSYYRRHAGLAQHLLKKIGLEIDQGVLDTILDHHERVDGRGYPHMKNEQGIYPPSQIVGCVAHIFDYTAGNINGEKQSILSVFSQLSSGTNSPGLEKNFSASIIEVICSVYKVTEQQLTSQGEKNGTES